MSEVLFFTLALFAEIVGTIGGFGSSVFFVPMAGFFFDFKTVLGITAIFHVFSNISKIYLFRKSVDKKILLLFGLPGIIGVIIGALLSNVISLEFAEVFLGIFLVLFSSFLLLYEDFILPATRKYAIGSGGVAGFIAGLIGTGGAVRGLSLAAFNLEKGTFIATSASIDFGVDFSRSLIYTMNGYFTFDKLWMIPILIMIAFTGTFIGKLILKRVDQKSFKKIVLFLIFIIGWVMIFKLFA